MPHNKRTCRLSTALQENGMRNGNYHNDRTARKAIRKEKLAKQARKKNRKK